MRRDSNKSTKKGLAETCGVKQQHARTTQFAEVVP